MNRKLTIGFILAAVGYVGYRIVRKPKDKTLIDTLKDSKPTLDALYSIATGINAHAGK